MPTLNWIGKEAVVNHHNEVPFHLLRVNPDLSVGDPGAGNLLLQGDNLLALKALLPYYAGQVKCIYIDPPYNTGSEDWVYNDNVNSPEIRKWLGKVVGGETEDLTRHDKWLCMMYPRLVLLKQFLRQDGVIIVSIDDNELADLRILMDEIFGAVNWVATLVWEKTRKNDAKFFSVGHDYMFVYARDKAHLRSIGTRWREAKPGAAEILEKYHELRAIHESDNQAIEEELRDWYRSLPDSHPSKALSRYKHVDERGVWRDRDISWPGGGGPRYDVIHPMTGKPCRVPERGWGFASPEAMQEQIDLGLVEFRKDHTEPPIRKAYLSVLDTDDEETEGVAGGQVMPSVIYRHTQPSVRLLRRIMGKKAFNNPKDHEVLARLFRYVTGPNDIILDSFAGSGSTGHAVLQINKEDRSNRRFILVEMEHDVAEKVTAERLKRVVNGYNYSGTEKVQLYFERLTVTTFKNSSEVLEEMDTVKQMRQDDFDGFETKLEDGQIVLRGKRNVKGKVPGLGGGFRYCELGATLFDAGGQIREGDVSFSDLARHVYLSQTGVPLPAGANGDSPLLGVHNGDAVYLLYNGILGDASRDGGNVLTPDVLRTLPPHDGPRVVFGYGCTLDEQQLMEQQITFRHIPYDVQT